MSFIGVRLATTLVPTRKLQALAEKTEAPVSDLLRLPTLPTSRVFATEVSMHRYAFAMIIGLSVV